MRILNVEIGAEANASLQALAGSGHRLVCLRGEASDAFGVGTNVHVIARVGSIDGELLLLEPVKTRVRVSSTGRCAAGP